MALINGTINTIDSPHVAVLTEYRSRSGSIFVEDKDHVSSLSGIVIEETLSVYGDSTFVQDSLSASNLNLILMDSTFIDGILTDGTYVDSTYVVRWFNPIWLNYSIWNLHDSTESLIGTRERTPYNPRVGYYYANMYAPDPGPYEIRWRYQKDTDVYAKEIRQPFMVVSRGIDPDRS